MNRWARLAGLVTLWAGVELLERAAYRAGVETAAADEAYGTDALLSAMYRDPEHPLRRAVDQDDELEAFDASDVLDAHGVAAA